MKVLSLFDGISCARVALERAGIKVGAYFASEIEERPVQIAQRNYPDTKQLGSVTDVKGDENHAMRLHLTAEELAIIESTYQV